MIFYVFYRITNTLPYHKNLQLLYNENMADYKHILIDMDDTLLDFGKSEKKAFAALCSVHGRPWDEDMYRSYSATNLSLWKGLERQEYDKAGLLLRRGRYMAELTGIDLHPDDINREFMGIMKDCAELLPGALDFVKDLRSIVPDVRIVTNGTTITAEGRYKASGLCDLIEHIYISDKIGFHKPSAEFWNYVVADTGDQDLSSYLVIGDSLTSDITGALSYGFDACLYTSRGSFPAGYEKYQIKYLCDSYECVLSAIR